MWTVWKVYFLHEKHMYTLAFKILRIYQKWRYGKMVLQPLGKHISPECDGSGYMMCMFSDSLDCLGEFLGVEIDVSHGMLILTPSNPKFYVSWAVTVQNGLFRICESHLGRNCLRHLIVYTFWTRLPQNSGPNMCESKNIILTRKLKISEQVIRKWEIGTYLLVFHPVVYGGFKVFLTCVTTKSWHRKRPNPTQVGKIRFWS